MSVSEPAGDVGAHASHCRPKIYGPTLEGSTIELDPKYVGTIILRWQEFSGHTASLDGNGRSYEGREGAAAEEKARAAPVEQLLAALEL